MDDANVLYYLEQEMEQLTQSIKDKIRLVEENNRRIDDYMKEIAHLKIHYTSLLNTALAYGHIEEDD